MIKKLTKTITRLPIHRSFQKTTKHEYQYFIIPCANSPPKKEKMDPSGPPPGSSPELPEPLLLGQDVLGPLQGPPRTSPGPFQDPAKTSTRLPENPQHSKEFPKTRPRCSKIHSMTPQDSPRSVPGAPKRSLKMPWGLYGNQASSLQAAIGLGRIQEAQTIML